MIVINNSLASYVFKDGDEVLTLLPKKQIAVSSTAASHLKKMYGKVEGLQFVEIEKKKPVKKKKIVKE